MTKQQGRKLRLVLRDFLKNELSMQEDVIHFHNVHRLKPRRNRNPSAIIAKFVYHKDKEAVLQAARTRLPGKPFRVYQQYPQEISDRRKDLVPVMKDLRNKRIVVDKLYVDGQLYQPDRNRTQQQVNQQGTVPRMHTMDNNTQGNNGEQRQVRFT